jgi:hypothetical protein
MESEVGEGELNYNAPHKLNQLGFGHVKLPNLSKVRSAGWRVATLAVAVAVAVVVAVAVAVVVVVAVVAGRWCRRPGFAVMAGRCRAL